MEKYTKWNTPLLRQSWVVSSALFNNIGIGMLDGSATSLITQLAAPESNIKMSLDQLSWLGESLKILFNVVFQKYHVFTRNQSKRDLAANNLFLDLFFNNFNNQILFSVSSAVAFSLISYIPITYFIDKCGRRKSYLMNTPLFLIGIIITAFADDFYTLLTGRALAFLPSGSATSAGAIIIGEYTSPRYRAMFLNLKTVSVSIGILIVHVLGHYYKWRVTISLCSIPFILSEVICYTWPESPSWLAHQRKFKESKTAFYWLRGKSEDSAREIEELIKEQTQNVRVIEVSWWEQTMNFFGKFKKRNFLHPIAVFFFAVVVIEGSGRHIFASYATQLLEEMITSDLNPFYYNIAIDLIVIVSTLIASYLVTIVNLRTLMFTSGILSFIIINATSLLLYLRSMDILPDRFAWVPITLFTVFFVFSNLGCSCLPLALLGEIFPLEHRAVGSSLAGVILSVLMMSTLKVTPLLVKLYKIYGALSILGACLGISLLVLYFIMPETRNKTLLEIEYFFKYNKYREVDVINEDSDERLYDESSKGSVILSDSVKNK